MIAKAVPNRHGGRLASYMMAAKDGERAELWQLRGFASNDIVEAFRSIHVMAQATKCRDVFLHVMVRNREGEQLTREQWMHTANRIERTLGLDDHPRAIAFHVDIINGNEHMHAAWSRLSLDTMKAAPLSFFKIRLMKVARQLEQELGLAPLSNARAGLGRYGPTQKEERQGQRLQIRTTDVRECIRRCFDRTDCGRTFEAALIGNGLMLAQGDRRDFVVIDSRGGTHALGKRLLGLPATAIRSRLANLIRDRLPTIQQCRSRVLGPEPPSSIKPQVPTPSCPSDRDVEEVSMPEVQAPFSLPPPPSPPTRGDSPSKKSTYQQKTNPVFDPLRNSEMTPAVSEGLKKEDSFSRLEKSLICQFRTVMRALTRLTPVRKQRSKTKKSDVPSGFRTVARSLFLRLADMRFFESDFPPWDALAWLHTWGCTAAELDQHFESDQYHTVFDLSPRP